MKKMFFSAVCASLVAAAMCVTSQAAFEKTAVYKDGQFTDVAQSAWYANEVKSAYELGFMNGSGANTFSPDGTMTVAEGITIASRVNAINSSKTIPEKSGAKWYDMYIDYAKSAGIIKDGDFNSYDRNIRRYEMAELFANALPKDCFGAKNDISAIPDVDAAEPYADTTRQALFWVRTSTETFFRTTRLREARQPQLSTASQFPKTDLPALSLPNPNARKHIIL